MIFVRDVPELEVGDLVLVDIREGKVVTDIVRAVDAPGNSYQYRVWFVGPTPDVELHEIEKVLVIA